MEKLVPRIDTSIPRVPALTPVAQRNTVPTQPVFRADDLAYVSGLPPVNPETGAYDTLPIDAPPRRMLDHPRSCCEPTGSALKRLVRRNVSCSNPAYFAAIEMGPKYFGAPRPARIFMYTLGWFGPFDLGIHRVALTN